MRRHSSLSKNKRIILTLATPPNSFASVSIMGYYTPFSDPFKLKISQAKSGEL
jgi:hypothetical protein